MVSKRLPLAIPNGGTTLRRGYWDIVDRWNSWNLWETPRGWGNYVGGPEVREMFI